MLKLDSLLAFVTSAEASSISEAARRLQISKSVASERVAELERSVGATLLHRSTRKLTLTEDGIAFLKRAKRILREVSEATAELSERRGELVGPLRISAPVSFGILHLAPALNSFLSQNPRIELSVDLDDRFVGAADGFDARVPGGAVHTVGPGSYRPTRIPSASKRCSLHAGKSIDTLAPIDSSGRARLNALSAVPPSVMWAMVPGQWVPPGRRRLQPGRRH